MWSLNLLSLEKKNVKKLKVDATNFENMSANERYFSVSYRDARVLNREFQRIPKYFPLYCKKKYAYINFILYMNASFYPPDIFFSPHIGEPEVLLGCLIFSRQFIISAISIIFILLCNRNGLFYLFFSLNFVMVHLPSGKRLNKSVNSFKKKIGCILV